MKGIAFDIGTTTLVGQLWDLEEKKLLANYSRANPQPGTDVISRISFSIEKEGNSLILQELIVSSMNEIINEFMEKDNVDVASIVRVMAVGNTSMSRMLLNRNFQGLARMKAMEIGLSLNQECELYVLPNIAGHVGSDMLAVMLASDIERLDGVNLIVDIGTNGEILLSRQGEMLTCSTAAGPAFEGVKIKDGMKAIEGAIERVNLDDDGHFLLKVIGGGKPLGICGSGLVDAVAIFLDQAWMDETGKIDYQEKNYISLYDDGRGEIVEISQKDIREIQYAKGAIASGIDILMKEMDVKAEEINKIFLAGAFGNYLNISNAVRIGLIPSVDSSKVIAIGNGAIKGASLALLNEKILKNLNKLAAKVGHVELANYLDFQKIFLESMYF